jgi:hypothetical protein
MHVNLDAIPPLDLGGFAVLLAVLLERAPVGVDVLPHIVVLGGKVDGIKE